MILNSKDLVKYFKPFIVFVAGINFSGCNYITLPVKTSRLQSSEVSGKALTAKLSANYQTLSTIRIVQDATSIPPKDSPVETDLPDLGTGFDGGITLWPRLELFGSTVEGISMAGIKYQLLGDTSEASRQGNISLAIASAYGISKTEDKGSNETIDVNLPLANPHTNQSPNLHWTFSNKYRINDFAVIIGRRSTDRTLVYGGPFFSHYRIDGKFTQTYDGTYNEYPMKNRGNLFGANYAFEVSFLKSRRLTLTSELIYTWMHWSRMHGWESDIGFSLAFGYSF